MSWASRRNAMRSYFVTHLPAGMSIDRVDLTQLMNGRSFSPPSIPELVAGMTPEERAEALVGAIWLRPQIVGGGGGDGFRSGGRPFHIGASAPTEFRGSFDTAIFFPRGYGDDFLQPIVVDVQQIFHRVQFAGGLGFGDCQEPVEVTVEQNAKWAHIHISNPYRAIEKVAS